MWWERDGQSYGQRTERLRCLADAANLSARAGGIQIQMLTQLHADNLHLIQLLSMQLSGQARDPSGQSQVLGGIRASLKTRAPNYQVPEDSGQGGGQ